ncbi:MAG: hypothetical protein P1V20_16805 [Verrucomicrobiales bacterium]|nr:hypothetical protein [Verrucomicrobiales bacterium]
MKTIANFENVTEAEYLMSILRSEGITAMIPVSPKARRVQNHRSRVRLQVVENDEAKAVEIIGKVFSIVD